MYKLHVTTSEPPVQPQWIDTFGFVYDILYAEGDEWKGLLPSFAYVLDELALAAETWHHHADLEFQDWAQRTLERMAWKRGYSKEQTRDAKNWYTVARMIESFDPSLLN
jgi:hypothetical protein